MSRSADVLRLAFSLAGVAGLTLAFRSLNPATNPATVALAFLIVVLLAAAVSRLWVALSTSLVAVLAFNFFFLPPVGTFTIADPQNWIALLAFLAVSLVASNLSAVARVRTAEAETRRDELARLFDLSRDVLLVTESDQANASLASFISRRFDLDSVTIAVPRGLDWITYQAGSEPLAADPSQLAPPLGATPDPHRVTTIDGRSVHLVPLRIGTKPIGVLAVSGRPIEPATLDAVAGLAAIAVERAQFLDERKAAELARRGEELKSALLASLAHDLRTPLTAIRVAATNLQASWPDEHERREQSDLILIEVDRLTRLFHNILEMARIDAGVVTEEARWAAPSEIVDAARSHVEHALRGHAVNVTLESEQLVRLDPRLTAAALSHLLENAAQYAPAGSPIDVRAAVTDQGLTIAVRDHGPGIPAADLPHIFDRFYRGVNTRQRRSGTGMGLAIARGVLAVERGRIVAENCGGDGACFTIVVPAEVK